MKKFIAIILSLVFIFAMVGCGTQQVNEINKEEEVEIDSNMVAEIVETKDVKVGLICLHDTNSSYDHNFIEAFELACQEAEINYLIKTNVPEGNEAYEAACELADAGCKAIFADSFGHEGYMIQAAQEFPDVQFCHATGTRAHTEGIDNYHNAFASIYEGRYLDGIAAGMKLKEMNIENNLVGYVAAFPYAECISGYTSFFLGVRSIVPNATMKVIYTGSWYDEALEQEAANNLINQGCAVISSHADSSGVPNACEVAKVPFVFYNGSVMSSCPNTYIISTKINWEPYFSYMIKCVKNGEPIDIDWTGTLVNGSVIMTELNLDVAAEGTSEVIEEAKIALMEGELKVFNTDNFTVNGKKLESYMADVNTDVDYTPDTEVISNGYFHESEFRSAPYFDFIIDGIEVLG